MSFLSTRLSSTANTWNCDSLTNPIAPIQDPMPKSTKENKQMKDLGKKKCLSLLFLCCKSVFGLSFSRGGGGGDELCIVEIRPTKIHNPQSKISPDFHPKSKDLPQIPQVDFELQDKKCQAITTKKESINKEYKIYRTATWGLLYWFLRLGFFIYKREIYKEESFEIKAKKRGNYSMLLRHVSTFLINYTFKRVFFLCGTSNAWNLLKLVVS